MPKEVLQYTYPETPNDQPEEEEYGNHKGSIA